MYDTYFKNKCNIDSQEMFKKHYNNYKPTLDQIKNFDISSLKSSSEAANLAELKHNAARTFAKSDFHNLFSTPYNKELRNKYLEEVLPDFQHIQKIKEYRDLLDWIDCNPQHLHELSTFMRATKNQDFIATTFQKTVNYGNYILKHPDISNVIDIMSKKIQNCTTQQLEILNHVCTNYESFALVTFEPYLAVCVGNILFFKVFIPLHKAGAFSLFMNKVISAQLNLRANILERVVIASSWVTSFSTAIKPGVNSLLNICNNTPKIKNPLIKTITLFLVNYLFYTNWNNNNLLLKNEPHNNNTAIVSKAANKLIEESNNLDNPVSNIVEQTGKQIGFLIGKAGRSVVKGIVLGATVNNEETIKETAKKIDDYIENKKN